MEAKNGAVIRKHIGYGCSGSAHAAAVGEFYREHFNPYLNFHRPCGLPETIPDRKGKQRRIYRRYATPWKTLRQLRHAAAQLTPGTTLEELQQIAARESDTRAARKMQKAKRQLPPKEDILKTTAEMAVPRLWKSLRDSHFPSATCDFLM